MRYLIQFPAGTGDLVVDAISPYADNVQVRYSDDSAIVFDSTSSEARVAGAPFAKNCFVVLASAARGGIEKGVSQLTRMVGSVKFPQSSSRNPRFRTMIQIDGVLTPVDQRTKSALERAIATKTGQRVEPRGMCQEYWVIGRSDLNELLLCVRLPKEKRPSKAKGALSYELSSMLVAASRPAARDVFLDPFAGSGSIVLARLGIPARKIWYSDINLRSFEREFPSELSSDKRVGFLDEDAHALTSIPDGHVDVVVTDPPWGEHEDLGMPYEEFMRAMVGSFDRVLKKSNGRFVVLTSRRTAPTLEKEFVSGGFLINASHEILVNGHPATVFVGGRMPEDRPDRKPEEHLGQRQPSTIQPKRSTEGRTQATRGVKARTNTRETNRR